jgi:hypothetical protein
MPFARERQTERDNLSTGKHRAEALSEFSNYDYYLHFEPEETERANLISIAGDNRKEVATMTKDKEHEELLKKYAPVLRFSQGERFFPMKIEDYLDQCKLYRSVQFGVVHLLIYLILLAAAVWGAWSYLEVSPWWAVGFGLLFLVTPFGFRVKSWEKETDRAEALDRCQGRNCYLRFAKSEVNFAGCYLAVLALIALAVTFLRDPIQGVRIAGIGLLLFFAFTFLFKSESTLMVFVAVAMVAAIYYFFSFLHSLIGGWVYLCLGAGFLLLVGILLGFMKLVLPRVLGFVMALFSQATDAVAEQAHTQYKQALTQYKEGQDPYFYYGRVIEDQEGKWTILQYNYFYAFNDWRLAAVGANHHEGDWEAVSVFLKDGNPRPVGAAFSQHHEGVYRPWEQVRKVANPKEPYHSLVYVALGSHANYTSPDVSTTAEMWKPGPVQKFLSSIDSALRRLSQEMGERNRGLDQEMASKRYGPQWLRKLQRQTQEDAKKLQGKLEAVEAEMSRWGNKVHLDDLMEAGEALPSEFATGDGHRIGAPGDLMKEEIAFSGHKLTLERRKEVCKPERHAWQVQLIPRDSLPPWVKYQGLWGIKSLLPDESGPPGPKWDRVSMTDAFLKYVKVPQPRRRWKNPLKWRLCLEKPHLEECQE